MYLIHLVYKNKISTHATNSKETRNKNQHWLVCRTDDYCHSQLGKETYNLVGKLHETKHA